MSHRAIISSRSRIIEHSVEGQGNKREYEYPVLLTDLLDDYKRRKGNVDCSVFGMHDFGTPGLARG